MNEKEYYKLVIKNIVKAIEDVANDAGLTDHLLRTCQAAGVKEVVDNNPTAASVYVKNVLKAACFRSLSHKELEKICKKYSINFHEAFNDIKEADYQIEHSNGKSVVALGILQALPTAAPDVIEKSLTLPEHFTTRMLLESVAKQREKNAYFLCNEMTIRSLKQAIQGIPYFLDSRISNINADLLQEPAAEMDEQAWSNYVDAKYQQALIDVKKLLVSFDYNKVADSLSGHLIDKKLDFDTTQADRRIRIAFQEMKGVIQKFKGLDHVSTYEESKDKDIEAAAAALTGIDSFTGLLLFFELAKLYVNKHEVEKDGWKKPSYLLKAASGYLGNEKTTSWQQFASVGIPTSDGELVGGIRKKAMPRLENEAEELFKNQTKTDGIVSTAETAVEFLKEAKTYPIINEHLSNWYNQGLKQTAEANQVDVLITSYQEEGKQNERTLKEDAELQNAIAAFKK